jgi:hypothetical protein
MKAHGLHRRDVLRSTGLVVTALVAGRTVIFGANPAWALAPTTLDPHTAESLVVVAREMFPHDRLGMEYYAAVVASLDSEAAHDAALRQLLNDGVAKLDSAHGLHWVDLSEGGRIATLKSIEETTFFTTMRKKTISGLYGNPLVYQMFGYGGPSVEFGGYLERGFDDIGWLPNI